jgi:protein O-GlcNAc transferase
MQALGHGVPVVTLPGRFMRGRHSTAILMAADLPELIAGDVEEYIQLAVHLGRDGARRQAIAARMREGASRLFNDVSAVRALEGLLVDAVAQGGPDAQAA